MARNENPHCNDYDSEGRCGVCGQFDCYECDWGYPFDGCKCYKCENAREAAAEEEAKLNVDKDLESMSKDKLIAEAKKLRAGIRQHRDASGHNLCWYVPELWNLLPEKVKPQPQVPPLPEFMHNCAAYHLSLSKKSKKQ